MSCLKKNLLLSAILLLLFSDVYGYSSDNDWEGSCREEATLKGFTPFTLSEFLKAEFPFLESVDLEYYNSVNKNSSGDICETDYEGLSWGSPFKTYSFRFTAKVENQKEVFSCEIDMVYEKMGLHCKSNNRILEENFTGPSENH